jgi:rhodanese-related sulfurtransferase
MKKENYPILFASIITLVLLILMIFIFFIIKKNSTKDNSLIEIEKEKIEEIEEYDITFINPKGVFKAIGKKDFLIIDTRNSLEFKELHIESSINIPIENLNPDNSSLTKDKTLLIIEKEENSQGKKAVDNLKKAGFKINYLKGGLIAYLSEGYSLVSRGNINSAEDRAKVNPIDLENLGGRLINGERFLYLDVRNEKDFEKDHFENSVNIPLEKIETKKEAVPTGKILIIDENPNRSFQASVRLNDMNILGTYYLINSYNEFKEAVKNKTLLPN